MTSSTSTQFIVRDLSQPTRLDRLLRTRFPAWGRQAVQRLITAGQVKVNGRPVWLASWEIRNQDQLEILAIPPAKTPPPNQFHTDWLLAQEPELIVVNKPAGLLCEPTRWQTPDNLRDLAIARFGPLLLFHRLDRDTSGVVLLTRPGPINQYLDQAFKQHRVQKEYLAVVATPNRLTLNGIIKLRLDQHPKRRDLMAVVERGGQHAITRYAVVDELAGKQLVRLWPETGRTHQLRVHLAALQAPILGDRLYGVSAATQARLLLHAYQISLPAGNGYPARQFRAPLPPDFWPRALAAIE